MAIDIEPAALEDAESILALQKLAFAHEGRVYDDHLLPPLRQTLAEIEDEFTRRVFLKAVVGGRIVGSVRAHVEDGVCHIGRLVVNPDHWGQHIGTQLMHAIEHCFAGVQWYEIFTGHLSERALRLYERLGYAECDRRPASDRLTIIYLRKRASRGQEHAGRGIPPSIG